MKKIIISKFIYSLLITIFLIYVLFHNLNIAFLIIPFIIAAIGIVLKYLFLLLKKEKYVKLSNKIFLIGFLSYAGIILIYFAYTSIINGQYSSLFFILPFLIAGILLVRKYFFHKRMNMSFLFYVPVLLVSICLFIGLFLFVTGVKDTLEMSINTKNYLSVNGYFYDYDIYSQDEDGTTYRLKYQYEVNGKIYRISTSYGSNYIPDINSIRIIKYDSNNPNNAILEGTNSNNMKIFMGAFFTLGSFTFVLVYLQLKGYFNHIKIDIISTYMAFVILLVGIGTIFIHTGTTLSLVKTIESMGLWILIPIMMISVGSYLLIKNIFFNKQN